MGNMKKKYSADELLRYAYKYNQIPEIRRREDYHPENRGSLPSG